MDDIDRYVSDNLDEWCRIQGIRAEITDKGIIAASVRYLGIGKRNADSAKVGRLLSATEPLRHGDL